MCNDYMNSLVTYERLKIVMVDGEEVVTLVLDGTEGKLAQECEEQYYTILSNDEWNPSLTDLASFRSFCDDLNSQPQPFD